MAKIASDILKRYAFIAFIVLVPVFFLDLGGSVRDSQEKFFELFAMGVIALFFENIWLTLFMWLNIVSLVYNGIYVGSEQVFNVLIGCLLFVISKNYFKNKEIMQTFKPLLWVLVLDIIWMILQIFAIDPLFVGITPDGVHKVGQVFSDPLGLFGIKMANGIFLGICYPILSMLNPYVALALLIPLATTQASTAILAWFTSALFFTWHLKRKLFMVLLTIGLLGTIAYIYHDQKTDPKTFKSRFGMWHAVFKMSVINPIGYGPDSFRNFNDHKKFLFASDSNYRPALMNIVDEKNHIIEAKYYSPRLGVVDDKWTGNLKEINSWDNAHNEYLQHFFEYGYLGLFLLIGLLREMVIRFKNCIRSEELILVTSILIVYFVSSIAHFPVHLARLGFMFPIALGIFYARTETA